MGTSIRTIRFRKAMGNLKTPRRQVERRRGRCLRIVLPLTPGICRWCGCTDDYGCAIGCSWIDRRATLCSSCASLDKAVRHAAGRQALAYFLHDHNLDASARPLEE